MKEWNSHIKSFVTFDLPLQADFITRQFMSIHHVQQKESPHWSTVSTRQKLIAHYWFVYVLKHYSMMIGLAAIITLLLRTNQYGIPFLFGILFTGFVSFPVLYLFHYYPTYTSVFLPQLETVKEVYEQKRKNDLEKCRQAQLSNFALVLIYFVFTQTNKINTPACNDQTAILLTKLYGVDSGSVKKNLELILIPSKRKNLTERKKNELKNRFSEAYLFLEEINFEPGIQKLKELEMKLF